MPRDQSPSPIDVLQALHALSDAMGTLIATLNADRERTIAVIADLEQGDSVLDVAGRRSMADVRERLTTALQNFDLARTNARTQIFRALQNEGHSIGQIARLWGISRQLASRLIRDQPQTP